MATARPKNRPKLNSIWVNTIFGVSMGSVEFQYCSAKACLIMVSYDVDSPRHGALDKGPSTESWGWTVCKPSGVKETPVRGDGRSSFRPISGKLRPAKDISKALAGGANAWDARLALCREMLSNASPAPGRLTTMAAV